MIKVPKILGWMVVILAIIGGVYYVKVFSAPCAQPITYRLGTFDNRFGISQADFLVLLDQAGDIWSKDINKELLTSRFKTYNDMAWYLRNPVTNLLKVGYQ